MRAGEFVKNAATEYFKGDFQTNIFNVRIKSGEFTRNELQYYLFNLHYVISHTPVLLRIALNHPLVAQNRQLKAVFEGKSIEEKGHDVWAFEDLKNSGSRKPSSNIVISESMFSLVHYLTAKTSENPLHLLPYAFFGEYFIILAAPELLNNLEARCHIPRTQLSVIANHEKLDRIHWKDSFSECNEWLATPELHSMTRDVVANTIKFYGDFFHDVSTSGRTCDVAASVNHASHAIAP